MVTLKYAATLADCRGCLARLADITPYEQSLVYERALLWFDAMSDDDAPACAMPDLVDEADLLARFERAADRLLELGADQLRTELILDMLPDSPA